MQLTDKLIQALVNKYQEKGINVQRVLDNAEFQSLPLDRRLQLLEDYKTQLSVHPTFGVKPIISSAVAGGLGSMLTVFGTSLVKEAPVAKSAYAAVGGVSALLSAVLAAIQEQKKYKRDTAIMNNISNNKYLDAIINTSISPLPKSRDIDLSIFQKGIESPLQNAAILHAEEVKKYTA